MLSRNTALNIAKQIQQVRRAVVRLRLPVCVFKIVTRGIVMLMQPITIQNLADSEQRNIYRAPTLVVMVASFYSALRDSCRMTGEASEPGR